ncbi:hypothetical protein FF011L_50880 [Roseimaritima multifibrata]|uniref:DUF1795 domain-containing protein n=1 Tax=Roseimaritima multifibrata TaxID=1930274 RepID=A0A517MN23_9BACT|nr:hypothetical protein [Roseimaritima multifibrata]QDS96280.1 hypothetical protein FF011L_50880 [Roseimaritima multifibrata]
MPATFEDFGVRFLYPDNWELAERTATEESVGVTIEAPDGTFFAFNRYPGQVSALTLMDQVEAAMREEYDEVEISRPEGVEADDEELARDMEFYYLDLLIISRTVLIPEGGDLLLIQMQSESRDFEKNEMVFAAMLKSLRDYLAEKES